jgi:hypothetical protein
LFCVAVTTTSWAQCSKDTDCKGDRVCEDGACVAPPAGAAAASAAPPQPAPAPAAAAPPAAAPSSYATPATPEAPRSTAVVDTRRKRHSTGMMVGGIVMVSFVPVALLAAWVADIEQNQCEHGYYSFSSGAVSQGTDCGRFDRTIYGGLISAAVLMGVGVPLIIVGGKKEPAGVEAKLSPWATPHAGGLSLKLHM